MQALRIGKSLLGFVGFSLNKCSNTLLGPVILQQIFTPVRNDNIESC